MLTWSSERPTRSVIPHLKPVGGDAGRYLAQAYPGPHLILFGSSCGVATHPRVIPGQEPAVPSIRDLLNGLCLSGLTLSPCPMGGGDLVGERYCGR